MIIGKHLIAGEWQRSQQTFRSDPYAGIGREYAHGGVAEVCLLYTSPSPRDGLLSRMPSSA